MKYYVGCNTNQVYSMLNSNSLKSFSNTIEKLQDRALSFMSEEFIFLSKNIMSQPMRNYKTTDIFFPITLEFDFSNAEYIPAYFLVSKDNKIVLDDKISNLNDSQDNVVGAFVCGEIPISYLTSIIFENEENQIRFKKPSEDLWFPEELYCVVDDTIVSDDCGLTLVALGELAKKVDSFISEEDKNLIKSTLNKREKFKAISYFAVRETKSWIMGNLKSNVDFYILDLLDNHKGTDGVLFKSLDNELDILHKNDNGIPRLEEINEKDNVLLNKDENDIDYILFKEVINVFCEYDKDTRSIDHKEFLDIISDRVIKKFPEQHKLFDDIKEFLNSAVMNQEKFMQKLNGHPVFKAFETILEYSQNSRFMASGCEGLKPDEQRYAYMMYAALKGMNEVVREDKSNSNLEIRLEELANYRYKNDLIISCIPRFDTIKLCKENNQIYGIEFNCSYWMSRETTLDVLKNKATYEQLESLYKIVSKDKSLKVTNVEIFDVPVEIVIDGKKYGVASDLDELKKDIKNTKWIKEIVANKNVKVNINKFLKNYILNDAWYTMAFEKYTREIQNICRR